MGKELSLHNVGLVFGGGMCGMMGAVAKTTLENGGTIFPISTPVVWEIETKKNIANAGKEDVFDYSEYAKPVMAENITERKKMIRDIGDACCVLPGSLGTFDELFETLCLMFIGEYRKPVVILDIENYWQGMKMQLDTAVNHKFGKPYIKDLAAFVPKVADIIPKTNELASKN